MRGYALRGPAGHHPRPTNERTRKRTKSFFPTRFLSLLFLIRIRKYTEEYMYRPLLAVVIPKGVVLVV